jgi:hypothetical protein
MSIYTENDYKDRRDYLLHLAFEYDADLPTVYAIANTLGQDEDFDGLVSALQDWQDEQ